MLGAGVQHSLRGLFDGGAQFFSTRFGIVVGGAGFAVIPGQGKLL